MSFPAVKIENLRFRWPKAAMDLLVIDALEIEAGECVFLSGGSGSGKTTLLSLIGGILPPTAGDITLNGQNLNELSQSQRDHYRANHIGFIFQLFNLIPYLSVIDNILLACEFSKIRSEKIKSRSDSLVDEAKRLLTQLELNDNAILERPVSALSVGQQQRVATARALIGSPELIIADEPTSALDRDICEKFISLLIQECAAANCTLLFVSHDQHLCRAFDRTLVLNELNQAAKS